MNFAVDVQLADTTGYKLGDLGAEIKNDDTLMHAANLASQLRQ
jgi:hypothetical protein